MMSSARFVDKVAIVTGAATATGIGRATLARLASEGATLLFAERQGKLDLLVNFAGVPRAVRSVEEMLEDFVRILQVNLVGTFLCCREALPISANPRAIS